MVQADISIARWLILKMQRDVRPVQRSQHLTQQDSRVFGQSYVANNSSVAGLEVFLDEPTDHQLVLGKTKS